MIGVIWSFIVALVKTLFGVGASKDPSAIALATSNATAETELSQEQAANAVQTEAAGARAAADARLVRDDPGPANAVNTDAGAAINTSPDAHFRD